MFDYRGDDLQFKTKETALLGIMAAVVVVTGFLLYFLSTFFPIPGMKFVFLAPLLSFIFALILRKVNKKGTITIFSLILGGILSFITLFMGLAILFTGLLTELTGFIIDSINDKKNIIYTSAFFPVYSLLTFGLITQFLLGEVFFTKDNLFLIIVVLVLVYSLGFLGAKLADKFFERVDQIKVNQ